MNTQNKIATIILLTVLMLTSYYIRHVVVEDNCLDRQTAIEYSVDTQNYTYGWEKIPAHALTLAVTAAFLQYTYIIKCTVLCKVVRQSHIEYCGRKMVRAIMLQFHPD